MKILIVGLGVLCILLLIGIYTLNRILYCNENNNYVNDTIKYSYKLYKLGIITRNDVRQLMLRKKVSRLENKKDEFIYTLDELKAENLIKEEKYIDIRKRIVEL
ncbi:hypothetical protein [Oceanirhabdus sp. W0125-5]|uniref:hypothetical protein n=1 Tax=Oceanirhabdus sp. W0125-5 TaxID=2999116 RepID=UPI0022F3438D|nr:hypothetical protein [Oceanirhabdus sp. W0125-5]WBW99253.1 hypothetical protein OW730_11025 [Oceanirhabdus sp. W0125-5]